MYRRGAEPNKSLVRYAAYASRLKTVLHSMQCYAPYAYGLSRSVKPLAHHSLIRGAHAIFWGYILGDSAREAREARKAYSCNHQVVRTETPQHWTGGQYDGTNIFQVERAVMGTNPGTTPLLEDHNTVAMQRGFFHSISSMALPALTIRHIVKHTTNAMRNVKSNALRTGGPLGLILFSMPFFPYIVDKPVEDAVEYLFYKRFQTFWRQDAVGATLQTGRTE